MVEEELPGVGVEVELVLVTQRWPMAGGVEQRVRVGPLGPELAGQKFGVGHAAGRRCRR